MLWHARRVRRGGGTRALDVGCGTGNLLKRLAKVMDEVTGVEPHPATAAAARANLAGVQNAVVVERTFNEELRGAYDVITFVAALHHMPLAETLLTAGRALRPGGRLLVLGVHREAPGDWPWSLASMILNPAIGAVRHPQRAHTLPANMSAPTAEARETFSEIAAVMRQELPGVQMRRSLFWRYTAVWTAPAASLTT